MRVLLGDGLQVVGLEPGRFTQPRIGGGTVRIVVIGHYRALTIRFVSGELDQCARLSGAALDHHHPQASTQHPEVLQPLPERHHCAFCVPPASYS